MKRFFLAYIICLLMLVQFSLSADEGETRGLKPVIEKLDQNAKVGRQYLLVIGIDKYQFWNPLKNPVEDAKEIKDIITSGYFIDELHELYNEQATKSNILKKLDELKAKLTFNDSLLIFYAGHGFLDKKTNTGFWIPVNAGTDVFDQANWLPNVQIRGIISNFRAIHICLISDSCFSGDILNTSRGLEQPTIDNDYFRKAYVRISRQVLTSGSSETVPDESSFAQQLKFTLKKNASPYLDALMLYNDIRLGVSSTTPLFGSLKDTGHQDGASFILFLKEQTPEVTISPVAIATPQPTKEPVTMVVETPVPEVKKSNVIKEEQVKEREKTQDNTDKAAAGEFVFEAGSGMTFPVMNMGSVLAAGYNPVIDFKYNFAFDWGLIGIGVFTGAQIESTAAGFAYQYSMYSFPIAAHLSYMTNMMLPFFLVAEADGGAVLSVIQYKQSYAGLSDTMMLKPFASVGLGVGFRLTDAVSISVTGNFIVIMFDNTLYAAISPVAKIGVSF